MRGKDVGRDKSRPYNGVKKQCEWGKRIWGKPVSIVAYAGVSLTRDGTHILMELLLEPSATELVCTGFHHT